MEIGRLHPVPLRELWVGEATHFTPWLAEDENLALLGETLGLQLELEAVEKQIGPFVADVVAQDVERKSTVLIENQLEQTDHRHLGQILTYAAGIDAETIIWIAQRIHEQHRAAIDWLNEISGTHFRFFAIEIQAWTLGGDVAAPQFKIVSKPNDWSKTASTSVARQSQDLTETQQRWRTYWEGLVAIAEGHYPALSRRAPAKGNWQTAETRTINENAYLNYVISDTRDKGLRAEVYLGGPQAKEVFEYLRLKKEELEGSFGEPLEWEFLPHAQASRVAIYKNDEHANFEKPNNQYGWLIEKLKNLVRVFDVQVAEFDGEITETPDEALD